MRTKRPTYSGDESISDRENLKASSPNRRDQLRDLSIRRDSYEDEDKRTQLLVQSKEGYGGIGERIFEIRVSVHGRIPPRWEAAPIIRLESRKRLLSECCRDVRKSVQLELHKLSVVRDCGSRPELRILRPSVAKPPHCDPTTGQNLACSPSGKSSLFF